MFLCFERSKPTGWMYVNLFPYSEVFGSITMVRWLIFGGFLAALAIALLVMKRISGSITQPLEKLSELMKMVESGDFQAVKQEIPNIIGEDEVGVLTREFRIMLDKMDYLIYENYEKQLLLQDTRYKMLQSQINPHFLYNTLNTINWMARAGKCKEVSTMILELGKLLRASFAKDSYTSVAEELNTAKSYMAIQKYRYQSRVEFVVEAEGDLERYMVPRMILQPLIENSIQYGVEESMRACVIRVTAREEAKSVMLEVKDQGKGMTREELEAVRNATVIPKGHGIGLKNIQERLKITYTAYEMRIESQPGDGTSVIIRVPKEEKGLEHVQTSDRR